jgi:hypothetical protein
MVRLDAMTTDYLGETIKLVLTELGWRAWWVHSVMGALGDGMDYPTADLARHAVEELIQRSGAIDVLLATIDEWKLGDRLSEDEHHQLEVSLLGFIIC